MYDVDKKAYSGVNVAKIPSMGKDELVANGDRLKHGSDEQIKAGLNLWMMALKKNPTDTPLINKIAKYQQAINDDKGALQTYETGINDIEQKGNGDKAALGNLYLGKAQLEIYSRGNKNYEQAKIDLEKASELDGTEIDQSLMFEIEDGLAKEERRNKKA